jgi:hypothetical protein
MTQLRGNREQGVPGGYGASVLIARMRRMHNFHVAQFRGGSETQQKALPAIEVVPLTHSPNTIKLDASRDPIDELWLVF